MADNVQLSAGTADGAVVATDDITSVHYQINKLAHGALNSATLVSTASGLPVQQQGTWTVDASGAAVPVTDNGGALSVDDAGGSLTVDNAGTFAVQATQADGANSTLGSKGDAKSTATDTTAISAMSVLKQISASVQAPPSQAVTNAGTFATQVDGAALTSLQLIDDGVYTDDTSTHATGTSKGYGMMAAATPTDGSVDANDIGMVAMTTDRKLHVSVRDALPAGTNAIGKLAANSGVDIGDVDVTSVPADPFGANADAASATGSISAKLRFIAGTGIPITGTVTVGSHAVTNAGTFVVQENGSALTALQKIDDPVLVDDAGFTPATSSVMMAGFEADESSTDSVDEGDAGAARMTLDRKQIVTLQPHTAGGLSTAMFSGSDGSSILVATAQVVKASAGQLYGYYAFNPEAATTFVHFYNTAAASVTVGTTNPLFTIAIPAGSAANLMFPHGVLFSNAGWSVAATTTAGGNTAPATGVSLVCWYL